MWYNDRVVNIYIYIYIYYSTFLMIVRIGVHCPWALAYLAEFNPLREKGTSENCNAKYLWGQFLHNFCS